MMLKESIIEDIEDTWQRNIFRAIRCFSWDEFLKLYEYYHANLNGGSKRQFQEICDDKGNTPLHKLCNVGSAPRTVIEKVLQLISNYGEVSDVIGIQNRYGDTPLHVVCRTSQMSTGKLIAILDQCDKSHCLTKNKEGQTPLHLACSSRAWFPVIYKLVRTNPSPLLMKDKFGYIPAMTLWISNLSNVIMRLELFDQTRDVSNIRVFKEFWEKMKFLLLETYQIDGHGAIPKNLCESSDSNPPRQEILHALFRYVWHETDKLFFAAQWDKSVSYDTFDKYGNLPIHILCSSKCKLQAMTTESSFQMKHRMLRECLLKYKDAAGTTDEEGCLLLHKLIESCPPITSGIYDEWSDLIQYTFHAEPKALGTRDVRTHFYPFVCAALKGSVNLTFQLLIEKPELVQPK